MCGLVAIVCKNASGFGSKELDVFETMLLLDTLRGDDSTGVFLVDNLGNVEIAKAAITGPDFLKTAEWKHIRTRAILRGFALVGHNRKATRGTVNDENAHPFWVEDKVVLVHNGSMFGSHRHLADTEVDSHAIAHVISEHPDDIEAALQKVNAAFALMWYDVQGKKFNILRNKERPLSHNHSANAWLFSSEESILRFAVEREDVKVEDYHSQPVGLMSTWDISSGTRPKLSHKEVDTTFRGSYVPVVYNNYRQPTVVAPVSVTVLPPMKPIFQKWVESRGEKIYEWQDPMAYGKWKEFRDTFLANDSRIRVSVSDFDWAIEEPSDESLLIGIWYSQDGSYQIPVVFPVKEAVLHETINTEGEVIYYVTVKNHYWANNSIMAHREEDKQRGFPYLWAEEPIALTSAAVQVH